MLKLCLQKDAKRRVRDIGDVLLAMEGAFETDGDAPVIPRVTRMWQRPLPLVLASLLLGAVAARLLPSFGAPAPPRVTRYALGLPETDAINRSGGLAWSPEGRYLAYPADRAGVRQLFLRARDQLEPIPISGTEGALHPFFSPDGQWIGFFADDSLKKVSVAGGPPVTLCPAGTRYGASWGPDDTIVFASDSAPGLWQVPAAGGEPKPLTTPVPSEGRHNWPEFLPGGRAVLFTISMQGQVHRLRRNVDPHRRWEHPHHARPSRTSSTRPSSSDENPSRTRTRLPSNNNTSIASLSPPLSPSRSPPTRRTG